MTTKKNTTAGGRLIQINGEGENPIHVDPSQVVAVTGEGQMATLHLVGGSSINVGRTADEVRKALSL